MEQIDLTGVYPGGEGAILQVQRFEGGKWEDFPVTASVSNETFSTYVQTSQTGRQPVPRDRHRHRRDLQRGPGHDQLTSARAAASRRTSASRVQ